MHKCTREIDPKCDHCRQTEDCTLFYIMSENQKNLDILSTNSNKTDRKKIQHRTTPTHIKR